MSLSDIAILKIHGLGYCCIITGIIKSEAMKLMQNTVWVKKWGIAKILKKSEHCKKLFSHIKMGKEFITFGDIKIKKKTATKVPFF